MLDVPDDEFDAIVTETLDALPEEFAERIEHVGIEVRDWPDRADRRSAKLGGRRADPLGFQQGVSELHRSVSRGWELPQRIVIYRGPHRQMCRDLEHLREEVRKTVLHEIGHYFGLDEDQLRTLGYG
jgi:predicted Zn-dependent protease with MMP-like domain